MSIFRKIREAVIGDLTSDDFPPAESSKRELQDQQRKDRERRERGDQR